MLTLTINFVPPFNYIYFSKFSLLNLDNNLKKSHIFNNFVYITFVLELYEILMFLNNNKITILDTFDINVELNFYMLKLKDIIL